MYIILAAYLALLLGALLFFLGRRGRPIDDHPICRKCRFDLSGKPTTSHKCSECGANLLASDAVRIGNRRTRPLPLYLGTALLFTGLPTAALSTYLAATGLDYLPYAPTFIILSQAQTGTDAEKSRAFKELNSRITTSAVSAIADRALAIQADLDTRWDGRWGNLVEHAKVASTLAPRQWDRYLNQIMHFEESIRPRIALSEGVLLSIDFAEARYGLDSTGASRFNTTSEITLRSENIEDVQVGPQFDLAFGPGFYGSEKKRFSPAYTTRLGSGTRQISLRHSWDVTGVGPLAGIGHNQLEKSFQLTILPAGEPDVHLLPRTDLVNTMQKCLSVDFLAKGLGQIHADMPPMDLAFQIFLVTPQKDIPLQSVFFKSGKNAIWGFNIDVTRDGPVPPGPVEILLKPSAEAAAETTDIFDIYGGEVRLPATLKP